MQTQLFRKGVLGCMVLGVIASMLAILSCGGSDNDEIVKRSALQGAAERPIPVATSANGSTVITISDDRRSINYVLTYVGLINVQQAHIHVGGDSIAGPVILYLCANGASRANAPAAAPPPECPQGPTVTVMGTLTEVNLVPRDATATTPAVKSFAEAINELLNGNTYTNVHTDDGIPPVNTGPGDFPGGEIRGQNL